MSPPTTIAEIVDGLIADGWRVAVDTNPEQALADGMDWWFGIREGEPMFAAMSPAAREALDFVRAVSPSRAVH